MGCGVLDVKAGLDVPGTTILNDDPNAAFLAKAEGIDIAKLKYGKGKYSHIVLVPQPSDDPNDPFNWPASKKWACCGALFFSIVLSGVVGPLLAAGQLVIAEDFNISLAQSAQATSGWCVFTIATGTLFWGPLMQKLGRRPVFLFSTLCMMAGSYGAYAAKSYAGLLAARTVVGIGIGAPECMGSVVLADLFHVHERGTVIALYNLAVLNGINFTPALSGIVINRHGYQYPNLIFAVFATVCLVLQYLFQAETLYHRDTFAQEARIAGGDNGKPEEEQVEKASTHTYPPLRTFAQDLRIFSGIHPTKSSVIQIFLRPFLLLPTPIVFFGFLVYGIGIGFIVLVAVSSAFLLSLPPYNFGPEQTGYIYFSAVIGTFLGALVSGLQDPIARRLAKRNKGIFESEFRLPMMVFFGLGCGFGYLGWGIAAQRLQHWIAPVVSFGLLNFGLTIGCTASIGYVVDSYGSASWSALTATMALKNYLSFSVSYWAADWIINYRVIEVFGTISGIHFAVAFLTIPMYVFGKKARYWVAKNIKFEDEMAAIGH